MFTHLLRFLVILFIISLIHPQGTAGILTYTISQSANSPLRAYLFFYMNPNNGNLSVSRSLLDDRNIQNFSFPVTVRDNGSPQESDSARVTVVVLRNINAPVFVPSQYYNVTIQEDTAVGASIIDLDARDADGVCR